MTRRNVKVYDVQGMTPIMARNCGASWREFRRMCQLSRVDPNDTPQALDGNLTLDYTLPWSVYILGACDPPVFKWHLDTDAGSLSTEDAVGPIHLPPQGVT